jgi:hypothetical protein
MVFFRCRSTIYPESCFDEVVDRMQQTFCETKYLSPQTHLALQDPFLDYSRLIFWYSKRSLTNKGDVLRAFAGIMRRFSSNCQMKFFHGLPSSLLDIFILFRFHENATRRYGFPSYSWTGWDGQASFYGCMGERGNNVRNWIVWYQRRGKEAPSLIWNPSKGLLSDLRANFAARHGDRTGTQPFDIDIPLGIDTTKTLPTLTPSPSLSKLDYTVLQFWTMVVFFKLKPGASVHSPVATMMGANGSHCGYVYLDGIHETTFFDQSDGGGMFEFILLSEYWEQNPREQRAAASSRVYSVMLLERVGDVAMRRGIGEVWDRKHIVESFPPGPQWKEILLG